MKTLDIALIGTRGVPARYGGFETAIEEIGQRLVTRGHRVTVFCRGAEARRTGSSYLGMELVHLPAVKHKVAETLTHTALSVLHRAARRADAAILFNAANAPLLPALKAARVPTAVHVDGLEWKRSKWGPTGRRYYLANEALAVRWADALIADARGIADYYRQAYAADTVYIPYGAPILTSPALERLRELDLVPGQYHLVVARFEPENHVLEALQGHAIATTSFPLVVVGSAPYAKEYVTAINALASTHEDIKVVGAVWDQGLLDAMYAGALTYVHGHSVGGTNPSLLRAMGAGAPVLAYDVNFNQEVLGDTALFWDTPSRLAIQLADAEQRPTETSARGEASRNRAASHFTWDSVTDDYEELCQQLALRGRGR